MPLKLSPTQIAFNSRGDGKFNKPFAEQVAFFRQKSNVPTQHYDDLLKEAHDRAFVVAGAMKADLLDDLRQAVDRAIAEGKSIQWFRKEFDNIVAKRGWQGWTGEGTKAGRDWRTRVIYRTNLSSSYAAGRWAQLNDPDLLKRRPFWKYIHNDTVLHPRPLHQKWSGMVLRHDDPFWQTHFPPNGWGCRCRIAAVPASEYNGDRAPDDGTYIYKDRNGISHTLPNGVDYGWDYAPGASLKTGLPAIVDDKIASLPKQIGAQLRSDVASKTVLPVVSDALKLPKSGLAASVSKTILRDIDAIHNVADLVKIPVKNSTSAEFGGAYTFTNKGNPVKISLSKNDPTPELTFAHEVGHFLDHQAFGEAGKFSSVDDPLFEVWRKAIDDSQSTKVLTKARYRSSNRWAIKTIKYYLERYEQWARSYAQWIATKSGNKAMIEQVESVVFAKGTDVYPATQWTDADFEPISKAIDDIFAGKGWLK